MIRRTIALAAWGITTCWACSVVPDLSKRPGSGPLFKIVRAGKYGYMDRSGRIVITPRFDNARDFFHGLAAVWLNGKAGYVNEQGGLVIPARFDDARDFLDELAPVRLGRRWGYVDTLGRMAIEPQFQAAAEFHQGLARIYVWNKITLDHRGSKTQFTKDTAPYGAFQPPFEDPCGSTLGDDGLFGFVDKRGSVVIPAQFAFVDEFSEGLAAVCLEACGDISRRRYGFIDRQGKVAFPGKYETVGHFSEGLARVEVGGLSGFIDKSGRVAIAPKYRFAGDFHNGLARVELGWRWGYIDRSGRLVVPLQFRSAWDFSEGIAVACNDLCTYIDRTGRRVISVFGNESSLWQFSGGLAPVPENLLFTLHGLLAQFRNRILGRDPGVFYIDTSGNVVGLYGR